MIRNAIVRAIDTGFGSTKFSIHSSSNTSSFTLIPSVAALATHHQFSTGITRKRRTETVYVDGVPYEVGQDAHLVNGLDSTKILNKNYYTTPEYRALTIGAISRMEVKEIDILVLGLPVSQLIQYKDILKKQFEGSIQISPSKSVTVKKVHVLPQAVGGLIDYALSESRYKEFQHSRTLIVDLGFYTIDWTVAEGWQPLPRRSGSYPGGMHAILSILSEHISHDHQTNYDDIIRLDHDLRHNQLIVFGSKIDPSKYSQFVKPTINQSLNALCNMVGDGHDISNILLIGGASHYFLPQIQSRYPRHNIEIVRDPVFANAKGFLKAGLQYAKNMGGVIA